jgi:soluble lytic murein transglycosylase
VVGVAAYALTAEPGWWLRLRYPLEYEHIIRGHAGNYELDAALIAAVIFRESGFDVDAVSSSGAVGLMQVLPDTGLAIAELTGGREFRTDDLYDPEINVRYGSFYLRRLLRKYNGDVPLALAAYNAGQSNVDEWLRNGQGILFPETREYVDDVVELQARYREAYGL